MTRKAAKDSVAGQIQQNMMTPTIYDIPEGMDNLTKLEQTAWDQYVSARTDWMPHELRSVHRLVKTETAYLEAKAEFESGKEGVRRSDFTDLHKMVISEMRNCSLQGTTNRAAQQDGKPLGSTRGKAKSKLSLLK
jgi:hypothetical protein